MADCSGVNPAFNPIGCTAQAVGNDAVANFADAMMKSYDLILKQFATSWLGKGIMVDLSTSGSLEWFKMSISVFTLLLTTLGLIVAGVKTMMERNGRSTREVLEALGRVVFVTAAGSLAVQVFVVGGDWFGQWILSAAGLDAGTFTVTAAAMASAPGLAIIIGIFGILTVLCQWGLMYVRGAILPLLVGWWPVAAAGAMLEGGKKGFEGVTKWILAFVIYSPVAASIYALAWRLKSGGDGVGGVINGWILIVLAVLTLPALMRLIAPAASALGKMAGGVMAMGITAAVVGAGVAIGAAVATGGASAGASGASAAGGGTAGGTAGEGLGGSSGQDSTGGKHTAGGADGKSGADGSSGSDGSSGGGSSSNGNGPVADGASDSSTGGSSSGGSGSGGGSGVGWEAAKGALDSSDNNDGVAEGMYAE